MPVAPASRVPVPATLEAADAIGGPYHDVGHPDLELLLTTRAAVRAGRARAGDLADEPLATGIPSPSRYAARDPSQIQRCLVAAAAVGTGHTGDSPRAARTCRKRIGSPGWSPRGSDVGWCTTDQ